MIDDLMGYQKKLERALRSVVRDALVDIAENGLPGEHHFYITFHTRAPGVEISNVLLAQYPDEMTIVLQHQFWGLEIYDDSFTVTLSFNRKSERLVVPFAAMAAFLDPSVNFGLQFEGGKAANADPGEGVAAIAEAVEFPARPDGASDCGPSDGTGEIVALDSFRKK